MVEEVFKTDSNLRSADAELQQRACEYLALAKVASLDVLATVLEEMPPFPEKESSGLLNLLKKKRPGRVPDNPEIRANNDNDTSTESRKANNSSSSGVNIEVNNSSNASTDLLGLGFGGGGGANETVHNGNGFAATTNTAPEAPTNNLIK